jgi:hypothetical protein
MKKDNAHKEKKPGKPSVSTKKAAKTKSKENKNAGEGQNEIPSIH